MGRESATGATPAGVVTVEAPALAHVVDVCAGSGEMEACGALFGTLEPLRVSRAAPVENTASDPVNGYTIAGERVRRLEREAGQLGLHVVGFYHSHPGGPAIPSSSDLSEAWPGYVYLIVGRGHGGPEARAWRLRDDRRGFQELLLRTGTVA